MVTWKLKRKKEVRSRKKKARIIKMREKTCVTRKFESERQKEKWEERSQADSGGGAGRAPRVTEARSSAVCRVYWLLTVYSFQ